MVVNNDFDSAASHSSVSVLYCPPRHPRGIAHDTDSMREVLQVDGTTPRLTAS